MPFRLLASLLLLLGSGAAHAAVGTPYTLSGTVTQAPDATATLRYTRNYISYEEVTLRTPLDAAGTFVLTTELTAPVEARLTIGNLEFPLFLEPGQEQYLTLAYNAGTAGVRYSGDGAAANAYLLAHQAAFDDYDMAYLQYELAVNTPLNYRYFLDRLRREKTYFLQAYLTDGTPWSPAFDHHARAEIDYWWAFHLMRYRYEHPLSINMPSPETLPYAYYDFLHIVPLSNDDALSSPHYSYFIDLFVRFVRENPRELNELSQNEPDVVVTAPTVFYFDGPLSWPVAVPLEPGARLHSVDRPDAAATWRRVRTYNGIFGRVRSVDVADEEWAVVARTRKPTQRLQRAQRSVRTYLRSRWNDLKIYSDPFRQEVMAIVHRGFEAPSRLGRTTDKLRYTHQNQTFLDHYLTIEMPTGETGWVFRGGVNQEDRVEVQQVVREQEAFTEFTIYKLAKDYLDGRVLQYALAKDIFLRSHVQDAAALKTDVDYFRTVSEVPEYREVVRVAYAAAAEKRQAALAARTDSLRRVAATQAAATRRAAAAPAPVVAVVQLPPPASCTGTQPTVVTLAEGTGEVELVLYADPVLFQEATYTLSVAVPRIELALSTPVIGVLRRQGKEQRVYLAPGADLELRAAGRGTAGLVYGGAGAADNAALRAYDTQFAAQDARARAQVRYAQPTNFRNLMDELYATRRAGLRELSKNASPALRNYLEVDADYWYGYQLFNYPWEHPIHHNRPAPQAVPEAYYSFTENLALNRDGALPNMNYTYYLEQYLDYQRRRASKTGETILSLSDRYLTGEARTLFRAKQFVAACRRGRARDVGHALGEFLQQCASKRYDGMLRYVYNEAIGLRTGSPAPDFTLTDIEGNAVNLSDFRGKVVYIDFWATWCAPCIRYMHHGKQLQRDYAGQEIVFLYVCLDEEADKWARYVELNGLTGVHVAATTGNAYHSQVARLYKVSNLPTYYLIDRAGNVAQNPAASPGGSDVRAQIDQLLYSR